MIISESMFTVRGVTYRIRSAALADAKQLSALRLKIDGETEYLDREPGEAFIDEKGFEALIQADSKECRHLFLVADIEGDIVGFSRCEGHSLKRSCSQSNVWRCRTEGRLGLSHRERTFSYIDRLGRSARHSKDVTSSNGNQSKSHSFI